MSIDNVEDITPRVQYVSAASQTAFDYPFPIFTNADLVVIVDGVTKTLTTDYAVSGAGDDTGGTVTFTSGQTAGAIVTIYRDIAIERTSDFQQNGPLASVSINDELDRITLVNQQLKSRIARCLRIPIDADVDDADIELTPFDSWKGKYITIDSNGKVAPAVLASGTLTLQTLSDLLFPQTTTEDDANVVPADTTIPHHKALGVFLVDRYQVNTTPGTTDMKTGWNNAIAACYQAGGGWVVASPGAVYSSTDDIVLLDGVRVELNGATVNFNFVNLADKTGFVMGNHTELCNGTVGIPTSGNPTSLSNELWCPVLAGASGGNLAGVSNFKIHDLELSTSKSNGNGGTCVLVQALCKNFEVYNIHCPDATNLGACVRISFAGNGVTSLTQHPHDGEVYNITFGTMTKAAAVDVTAVDIIGCYNIKVRNVGGTSWAGDAVVAIRPGGFGSYYASAEQQAMFMQGIEVDGVLCNSVGGSLVSVNGKASGAPGTPSYSIPAVIRGLKGVGLGGSATLSGIHCTNVSDVLVEQFDIEQFLIGVYTDDSCKRITYRKGRMHHNQKDGAQTVHGNAPDDITFEECYSYLNNQANSNYAGFYAESATNVRYINCIAGDLTSETKQLYGFRSQSDVSTIMIGKNRVPGVAGGGIKYSINGPLCGNVSYSSGSNAALSTTNTEYLPVGGNGLSTTEAVVSQMASVNQVISQFKVKVSAAPNGASKTRRFRVVLNGAATALDVTLTNAETTGTVYSAVEVASGDILDIIETVANTPDAAYAQCSIEGFKT